MAVSSELLSGTAGGRVERESSLHDLTGETTLHDFAALFTVLNTPPP